MSIYTGDKKTTLYKGDCRPAKLFKGNREIVGFSLETFTGASLEIEKGYNDKPYEIIINSGFTPSKNLFNKALFAETYPEIYEETALAEWGTKILGAPNGFCSSLKPSTTYTISFEAEGVAIPDDGTVMAKFIGFAANDNGISGLKTMHVAYVISPGEIVNLSKTFTTAANYTPHNAALHIYTNRYRLPEGGYFPATVILRNIQVEEGTEATEFEPFRVPAKPTLVWNGEEIPVPYALGENHSIILRNSTVLLCADTETDISETDFGKKLLSLSTKPNQTASISHGSLSIALKTAK